MSHVKSYSQRLEVSGRLVESDALKLMPYGTLDVGIVVRHVYRWIEKKCHSFSFTVRTGLVLLSTWLLKKKKNFLFIYRLNFG